MLPGDRLVMVVDGKAVTGDAGTLAGGRRPPAEKLPWYDGLMQSLSVADGNADRTPEAGR